ncbi:MAG: hypothetical protein KDH97_11885 [Calditrichaeota bacterium]|nr:hypothetical protein [Calditrichota bacterium]MCB0294431.1 hypothetical protein [Calditrichota bacterium]MCB0302974.1 hypothetical protein [Calditrichota bacterium]MCB0312955.1 hypothetical protein [Calditrichota bacterium]MCB9090650.1 hypothetical protein [Calditrichia bacterium]
MVSIISLWLPILVSAVFVFIASAVIHMVLGYHASDMQKLPEEDKIMEFLRRYNIPPGDYSMPRASSMKEMGTPGFIEKMKKGPVAMMTFVKSGPPSMNKELALWFVYCLVVGIFAAYIAGRAVGPGAHQYLEVFRFAGCTAFVGYTLAQWQETIWYKRNVMTTLKSTFDGLIYALLTAGTFGWLWPV